MVAYERDLMTRLIEGLCALPEMTIHGITDPHGSRTASRQCLSRMPKFRLAF
jgi:selenocysteine lyase/cysteine desulfurase